jgi:hypothetical protein
MSLLQIADSTGKMNYVCSNAAKHELEPVEASAHCVLFHRKPRPAAHSLQGPSRDLGDHAALAKARSALDIRSNRCPNPAPSVLL